MLKDCLGISSSAIALIKPRPPSGIPEVESMGDGDEAVGAWISNEHPFMHDVQANVPAKSQDKITI